MILDNLTLWRQYAAISPRFEKAFSYLCELSGRALAERIAIDGDNVFALVVKTTTKPVAGRQLEVHRKYIDI